MDRRFWSSMIAVVGVTVWAAERGLAASAAADGAPAPPLVVAKLDDSLVDREALTIQGGFGPSINGQSFQQDAIVSHRGWQYVAYYDGARHVAVGRRRLPDGPWQIVRLTDYPFQSNDAHNIISLGLCPKDGTIHLAFDHHGHPLHYRVSAQGAATEPEKADWTPALFSPVISELERGMRIAITYPRFLQTPGGGLQFFYRRGGSGNGDRMMADYDPEAGTWKNTRQIDSRQGTYRGNASRCSYPNGYTYGPDGRLHATWVWREGPLTANHDLVYVSSADDGVTWWNNAGERLDGPPHLDSPGVTVVEIGPDLGLMNTHGQAVDSRGRVHVVMWHCTEATLRAAGSKPGAERWGPPAARRYHHYWRDESGRWQHRELPWPAGNRPKVFVDRHDNLLLVYGREGHLEIAAASAARQWNDWQIVHVEPGPFVNEMLGDPYRWQADGVLSVLVQAMPAQPHDSTPLRIVSFSVQPR